MNGGMTLEFQVRFDTGPSGRRELIAGAPPPPLVVAAGRVPRVSRLMALAIRFDELVRRGEVEDFAQIASLGHVTRARVSQIAALLNLAPDIQEQILFLPLVPEGRDPITERDLRPIAAVGEWGRQRALWRRLAPPGG